MKTVTITAEDKNGVVLGKREDEQPETFAELLDQFEEGDILKLAWRSHVIDVQRELRAEARGPKGPKIKTPAELAFDKLSQAEKDKLMGLSN